jgi:predicted transcriptional regulator
MFRTNPLRSAVIYSLWEKGYTVDQIALETGVPRSTVGYYVRKFNKYAKDGRPVVIPQGSRDDESSALTSAMMKLIGLTNLIQMLNAGEYQKVYYVLSIMKLLKELRLFLTPEENRALKEAFRNSALARAAEKP